MGLDTTHNCWHGSYGKFNEWRHWLCRFGFGEDLDTFEGYWKPKPDLFPESVIVDLEAQFATVRQERKNLSGVDVEMEDAFRSSVIASLKKNMGLKSPRSWDELEKEPLAVLFNHSDCDGEISARDCAPLADRMEQVLVDLPKKWEQDAKFYECTLQFIVGLRLAASHNEDVLFL